MGEVFHRGTSRELDDHFTWSEEHGHYHSTWASPEEFYRHIASLQPNQAWEDAGWSGDKRFTGTESMAEAMRLAQQGWKEGIEMLDRAQRHIRAKNPIGKQNVKYSIAGTVPNIPRAVAGNILNMKAPKDAKMRKRPIITLVANMCSSCGVSNQVISNRSAATAAIIDEIEAKGFACEVISTAVTSGSWTENCFKAATSVVVKKCDQPVDVAKLAFALGHASFFRRMVFADWGTDKRLQSEIGHYLGRVYPVKGSKELAEKGVYVLPSAGENTDAFKDEDTAASEGVKFIIDKLKEQECPAF